MSEFDECHEVKVTLQEFRKADSSDWRYDYDQERSRGTAPVAPRKPA